jgi:hypothetical protein
VKDEGFPLDRKTLSEGERPIEEKRFSLATGKGVRIGFSSQELYKKLGGPTKVKRPRSKRDSTVWTYLYPLRSKQQEWNQYRAEYVFKRNRLVEIAFFENVIGGA